ncbi:MAG: J domain-containing protein [Proteobacteria bacterium]|nr:J domain-containing protein [Pseudomonadota bacterium]
MKLDSKYFDKIRMTPRGSKPEPKVEKTCEWPGCEKPARHKAPKGRNAEGQFHAFCLQHVQEYNKSYNYFAGMGDASISDYQKASQTGHRPTWKLGENAHANAGARRGTARNVRDPLELLGRERKPAEQKLGRTLRKNELAALQTLGLDENATPDDAKAKYKLLVKRLHPDANGGSRANEDTLKAVIQAYDTLRASGFC